VGRVFHIALYGLFFLLLSVAGREIPEISTLVDDPSNDEHVVACAEVLPSPNLQRLDAADISASFDNSQWSFRMQDWDPSFVATHEPLAEVAQKVVVARFRPRRDKPTARLGKSLFHLQSGESAEDALDIGCRKCLNTEAASTTKYIKRQLRKWQSQRSAK